MRYAAQQRLIQRELAVFKPLLTTEPEYDSVNVQALLEYVHEHVFEKQLNVNRALQACGLKDHNVSSRFKLHVGRGLRTYIEDLRLMAAIRLLWHEELDIYLIASAVGYKYHESFTRAFKRSMDYTPTDFRKQFVNEAREPTPLRKLTRDNHALQSLAPV